MPSVNEKLNQAEDVVRASRLSLKETNASKLEILREFVLEYECSVSFYVDALWRGRFTEGNKILNVSQGLYDCPKFCPKIDFDSPLTGRALKCAQTQAMGIVKAVLNKRVKDENKFIWKRDHGIKDEKLEKRLANLPTMPEIKNLGCELNSIVAGVEGKNSAKTFDLWLDVHSMFKNKRGLKIQLPLKKHSRFLHWEAKGTMLNSVLLKNNSVEIRFKVALPERKTEGTVVAIDQGIKACLTTSDSDLFKPYQNGRWDLDSIIKALSKKKSGSKAFLRFVEFRRNYIGFIVNQLDLSNVKEMKLEEIVNMKFGRNVSRQLKHFSNPLVRDALIKACEEQGVLFTHVPNEFNSQRCNKCGWTQKSNRNSKVFKCKHCHHVADADENATQNIKIRDQLFPLDKKFRFLKLNREGFFWNSKGIFNKNMEEITVPSTTEKEIKNSES